MATAFRQIKTLILTIQELSSAFSYSSSQTAFLLKKEFHPTYSKPVFFSIRLTPTYTKCCHDNADAERDLSRSHSTVRFTVLTDKHEYFIFYLPTNLQTGGKEKPVSVRMFPSLHTRPSHWHVHGATDWIYFCLSLLYLCILMPLAWSKELQNF